MVSSTPRPHFTPGKDPVPIVQEAGWAPGPVWTDGKSRPHRDSIPDRPARSQLLYRLSYRAHTYETRTNKMYTFYIHDLIILSSTCFEHPSVYPQEDLYMQFYGISFMHPYKQPGRWHILPSARLLIWMRVFCIADGSQNKKL